MADDEYLEKLRADILKCVRDTISSGLFSAPKFVKLKTLNRLFVTRARKAGMSVSEVVASIPEIESARCEKTNGIRYALREDLEGKNLMVRSSLFGNTETANSYGKYYEYIDVTHDQDEFNAMAEWLSCLEGVMEVSPEAARKWLDERKAGEK